jgi:dTDP-4-amino-4,6-dideoxygalactose transaminase
MNEQDNSFLTFGSPAIGQEEIDEVIDCLKTGWLGTGPKVKKFEEQFKYYNKSSYAVGLNSCTAALHLSLLALGISQGDEVITTPLTFCATINSIIHAGGKPVLADVEPVTMNIDPVSIQEKITEKTKCILPVHFAGRPCDMDAITKITRNNNLYLVEDCAHAIETEYKNRTAGTFGEFGCFSFYVTKNVVTGEGGMVVTNNDQYADRVKRLALHGMSKDAWKRFSDGGYQHYYVEEAGYKYNMMDLQAAIGIHQLNKIEPHWQRRQAIWNFYNEEMKKLPITLPPAIEAGTKHSYHLYTILIDEKRTGITRDEFLNKMQSENIGCGVHYLSIPEHPYYQRAYGWKPEDYPNAMRVGSQTISLPLSPKLTDKEIQTVTDTVKRILK